MSTPVVIDTLTVCGANGQELFGPTSFAVAAGTVTALTGPSGSGKTTLMRALLGHLPVGTYRSVGVAEVAGQDVFALSPEALQRFRRNHIAYVGQDPGSALNPLMRVRSLLGEMSQESAADSLLETLELVGLSAEHLRRRPGELSGGQQRRVALARALVRHTSVLVLDEPLAGLHGSLRTEIARVLADIAAHRSAAIVLSGHDTAAVHAIADNVVELGVAQSKLVGVLAPSVLVGAPDGPRRSRDDGIAGDIDSEGSLEAVVAGTGHAYVPVGAVLPAVGSSAGSALSVVGHGAASVGAVLPGHEVGGRGADTDRVAGRRFERTGRGDAQVVLRVRNLSTSIGGNAVLSDIDLELGRGASLAVVGASGAGKTTLARAIAGLHRESIGSLELRGEPMPIGARRRKGNGSNGIQLVTQNPRSALNPRRTVAQTLGRPLRRIGKVPKRQLVQRITELLGSVELAPELAARYPHQLSGGQRQRVALARALAAEPAVLVCDEITSALDHDTASSIMTLLDRIRADHDTALVVISHDIPLIATHCPRLVVLDHGRIIESGDTAGILASPAHSATGELLGWPGPRQPRAEGRICIME
ncbi:ABC transporter ATP-binding protein [Nocardia australiensis]|uniref:ABC transporter ATP-binding protein n=1 Tax=Nocardia australiensis TaxID=2887191 RepID=UPI001D14BCCB|nr:ATP-binding cassette domain-containing protein [Nocardia australiensis]